MMTADVADVWQINIEDKQKSRLQVSVPDSLKEQYQFNDKMGEYKMKHEEALLKAEYFQQEAAEVAKRDYWRPQYHIVSPSGWINDPNGFCYYGGKYHLFYQYHPYSPQWGPMHWGHVTSRDLVNWQTEKIALAPTDEYDKDGCFSGSAIEKDGKMYVVYTGHVDLDKSLGGNDRIESQCLAVSEDGIHFTKYAQNPVVKRLPENIGTLTEHFRDPKVWEHDGVYYMVVGAQTEDETGEVVVYKSTDLYKWEFVNVMAKSEKGENLGFMWECPNFAELNDGQEALILSPQGMQPEANRYLNLHQSGYFLGKMDYETGVFDRQTGFEMLDYGHDFYAPQIMQDKKNGRVLMIAWLDMWESRLPEQEKGWAGMMSVPRVIEVKDGMIYSTPAPELEKLRKSHVHYDAVMKNSTALEGVAGDMYELNTVLDLAEAEGFALKLRVSAEDNEETVLSYDKTTQMLKLNRDKSGSGMTGERSVKVMPVDEKISLQIFSDRSSLEIFINGGQRVMSCRIYPTEKATGIVFVPNGTVKADVDFYEI